ncbi:hypothetical protein TW80_14835 [Loktanella sp. S4079]|nr:hypothetical protein TW80_14835 [Loktanella sp. S4079]
MRGSRRRRATNAPPIVFNSNEVALGEICVIGERANQSSRDVILRFADLLTDIYGRRLAVTFAGRNIQSCPRPSRVYLRLYSGRPPSGLLNADLRQMDRDYDIRLPAHWREPVASPAQTNGYFGYRGAVAHLLVRQAPATNLSDVERAFYRSILIEELFQVVSFGADVLKFDLDRPFLSKLQEHPVNLRNFSWYSTEFMAGLLASNPQGLCSFDVMMLHALAGSGLNSVNSPELIRFMETNFDALVRASETTISEPSYAMLLDPNCSDLPD